MQEVIEIIEKLKELSGNEQLNYLYSHKDNLLLKKYYNILIEQIINIT